VTSSNTFRSLHHGDPLLILPNAWDPGSARLIESLGAKAIATTSAGLAWSRGYADGDALPARQLLITAREIARAIQVPLTVDIEGGYSIDPTVMAEIVTDRGIEKPKVSSQSGNLQANQLRILSREIPRSARRACRSYPMKDP
jgi:2-methylisocitrate lyase-like PEP mutase family enzyme